VRVPVIARVLDAERSRYVRLGPQFCVADGESAVQTLSTADFRASLLSPLDGSTPAQANV
jgi:DNA polymerase-3 subunit alpha